VVFTAIINVEEEMTTLDPELNRSMTLFRAPMSRRALLKRAVLLGVAVPAISGLLAACGDDDEDVAAEPETDDAVDDSADSPAEEPDDEADEEPDDVDVEDDEPTEDEEVEAGDGGTATLLMPQLEADPETMNPLFTRSGAEQAITTMHFGSLLKMDEVMTPVHDLAGSWEISDDATVVTFSVHEDANWSDGEPVTAEDVIFTLERAIHPEAGSTRAAMPILIQGATEYRDGDSDHVEGLVATDDKTVEITLADPNAIWPFRLNAFCGQGILPKHVYEDIEPGSLEGHELSRAPEVGAGTFLLNRWETEQFLEFVANDDYVGGRPSLDSVVLRLILTDVALAQITTGEIDITPVPVDEVERVEGNPEIVVESNPSLSITSLQINTEQPYLTVPVRQAMMYAIDRQGIVDAIYQGLAEVVHTSVIGPDWMGDIVADADLNTYEYDPDRAREILEEEGWDPNQTVELMYATGMETEEPALTIIQDNLQSVGINLELRQYEFAATRDRREDGEYDLALLMGGIYRSDPGMATFYYLPLPDGSDNVLRYNNPEFNELDSGGLQVVEEEDRREIYLEAAKILNEELPNLWLWSPYLTYAHNPRLNGFLAPNYFSNVIWNAEDWTVGS
jgi:ABC-type transport system substrate-binding protein